MSKGVGKLGILGTASGAVWQRRLMVIRRQLARSIRQSHQPAACLIIELAFESVNSAGPRREVLSL
jgi:hypothetical protein